MDGYEYVWIVTYRATLRLCGVFSSKDAALAEAERRGNEYQAVMYRVWDGPLAGPRSVISLDPEVGR